MRRSPVATAAPPAHARIHPLELQAQVRARQVVLQHGWNSTAYQILNPGISYWFTRDRNAVVGFIRRSRYVLVAGAPVCPPESIGDVIREFEAECSGQGLKVCYVCAGERLRHQVARAGTHAVVPIGAQPVWDPASWPALVAARSSLRAQLQRARNKGVAIEEVHPNSAARDPEIARVLDEWLEGRTLPPLHFLTKPEALRGVVEDRVVFVARCNRRTVAYLVASPVVARNGYLIEELARSAGAPNGTSELLIDAAMRRFAAEGRSYVTLGLVALARNVFRESPLWLRGLLYFARAHANRFYNFRGLEQFRSKLQPACWEKVYVISRERRFSLATLYAVGGAFSGIAPWRALALGLLNALRAEWHGRTFR